jgi:hypothetical protein
MYVCDGVNGALFAVGSQETVLDVKRFSVGNDLIKSFFNSVPVGGMHKVEKVLV